ncbi:hypothetical protein A3Q56_05208, partial [Intoshia linei]
KLRIKELSKFYQELYERILLGIGNFYFNSNAIVASSILPSEEIKSILKKDLLSFAIKLYNKNAPKVYGEQCHNQVVYIFSFIVYISHVTILEIQLLEYKKLELEEIFDTLNEISKDLMDDEMITTIKIKCGKLWTNEKKLCLVSTIYGNICNLPHNCEVLPIDFDEHVKIKYSRSACNCGRFMEDRNEPYSFKSANYHFYDKLNKICCHNLKEHDIFYKDCYFSPGKFENDSLDESDEIKLDFSLKKLPEKCFSFVDDEIDIHQPAFLLECNRLQKWNFNNEDYCFIGFEYECKKGHRFMQPISSSVNNENKTPEMPLFIKCIFPKIKNCQYAQLIRIFIHSNVKLHINPKIQIKSIIYSPQYINLKEILDIEISDGLWVLRFPYAYPDELKKTACLPLKNKLKSETIDISEKMFLMSDLINI